MLDDGTGPSSDERDVLFVRARAVDEAKRLALRAWRRVGSTRGMSRDYLDRSANPFNGLTVERIKLVGRPPCPHLRVRDIEVEYHMSGARRREGECQECGTWGAWLLHAASGRTIEPLQQGVT
jgi:hypothetical protein